ncbi:MAG TPA: CoA transferase, partial [Solirubrobacteraceae bacterium]
TRVLELATGLAGPYCGSLLADQGADVLKLEQPDGDHVRNWGPPFVAGVGAAFVALNRNKRIAPLPDTDTLFKLMRETDVVIVDAVDTDGNPPSIDLDAIRAEFPALIVCSISAYGERGPLCSQPGSELTVQAMSNVCAGLGRIGEPPRRLGADQCTINTGLSAYQGIAAALFRRERTGDGDRIAVSALGTILAIKGPHWTCLSNPDQWPGMHLSVWTDPPDHGIATKDRPILLWLADGVARPATREQVTALVEHFGGIMPAGLDLQAPHGSPGHPGHHSWRAFWSELFKDTPWEEIAQVAQQSGCEVTPWMDYLALDHHPQCEFLRPFVPLAGTGGHRVMRLPWRLGGDNGPLAYEPPRNSEAAWPDTVPAPS